MFIIGFNLQSLALLSLIVFSSSVFATSTHEFPVEFIEPNPYVNNWNSPFTDYGYSFTPDTKNSYHPWNDNYVKNKNFYSWSFNPYQGDD